jgi:hypothetical protein
MVIPRFRVFASALALLIAAGALGACGTTQIPLPEGLAASERMPVQGRQGIMINQRIRFGPYETSKIDRSWTRGTDHEGRSISESRRRQRFQFTVRDGEASPWFVRCDTGIRVGTVDMRILDVQYTNRSVLHCMIAPEGGTEPVWQMELTQTRGRPLTGTLRSDTEVLSVRGTNRLEKTWPTGMTTGYMIERDSESLAAVEVVNNGVVWFSPRLSAGERGLVAATAAALLALEDLSETID